MWLTISEKRMSKRRGTKLLLLCLPEITALDEKNHDVVFWQNLISVLENWSLEKMERSKFVFIIKF